MFQYPLRPNNEHEARALIWAALIELAALSWAEDVLDERGGDESEQETRLRMDMEHRQGIAIEALQEYSSQHWLSQAEYSEWWHATVGQSGSDVCKYLFEQ